MIIELIIFAMMGAIFGILISNLVWSLKIRRLKKKAITSLEESKTKLDKMVEEINKIHDQKEKGGNTNENKKRSKTRTTKERGKTRTKKGRKESPKKR